MAKNKEAVFVAGNWTISVGPVGTTEPTDSAEVLDAGFVDLGYTDADGVSFPDGRTTEDIRVGQSYHGIREVIVAYDTEITFTLAEWNRAVLETVAEATITETVAESGEWKVVPASDGSLTERSFVFDATDGDGRLRRVVRRAVIRSVDEFTIAKGTKVMLGVTLAIKGTDGVDPFYDLTNLAPIAPA
jgi:hypothetical protein